MFTLHGGVEIRRHDVGKANSENSTTAEVACPERGEAVWPKALLTTCDYDSFVTREYR